MIGDIHECALAIKTGRGSKVLLRAGDSYKMIHASSSAGIRATDPMLMDKENFVGVFTPSIPLRDIYHEAGEPFPERPALESITD